MGKYFKNQKMLTPSKATLSMKMKTQIKKN